MKYSFLTGKVLIMFYCFGLICGILSGCSNTNYEKKYRSVESIYTEIGSSPELIINDDPYKTIICYIYGIASKIDASNGIFYLQDDHNKELCLKCSFNDASKMESFFKKYKNGDALKMNVKIYRDESENYYATVLNVD